MITIDLRYNTLDGVSFVEDHFPDGQINIHLENLNRRDTFVTIITKLGNGDDVMKLLMASDIVKRQGFVIDRIIISYLYAARTDRLFDLSQPYSLSIIADIINSIGANEVFVVEPHNIEKTEALIKNCNHLSYLNSYIFDNEKSTCIVFPDAGASKRYGTPMYNSFIRCGKHRDPKTNELSGFELLNDIPDGINTFKVIDDLCDGGGTFCGIAKLIFDKAKENKLADFNLELYVHHLIQPNALFKLKEAGYTQVITTDSYFNEKLIPESLSDFVTIKKIKY
jgi:ribose-phosphate pyrophosphokinase